MTSPASNPRRAEPFQIISREKLSAVTFVLDYWQLQFDGPTINVMTRIEVRNGSSTVSDGDFRFRNSLCGQIGKMVSAVGLSDNALTITFHDRSIVSISLREQDYHGPEGVILLDYDSRPLVVIRCGE